ncbi:hypothetical protein IFM89_013470 [Coptis chinensis]|uniref:BHLH domain-containing protein n=1 Tax=Coptis chinensis TaxID=261450 RepID=A0A835I9E8_9MAGN|nr:hypothetical protein IFM89_013470 [Coptis chinensis]
MATRLQNNGMMQLRNQLAVAVKSIQWSYAIFWSTSVQQQGLLEWSDGYYNGDIKTRKTMQPMEFNVDKLGLKRSEQLRELYHELLVVGDTSQQAKRSSAALSPEDLSDAEWYYLVCMSFTFASGVGYCFSSLILTLVLYTFVPVHSVLDGSKCIRMPGRAFSSGQHIWLCNAPCANSKVFTRSLLAKTVVCFPWFGGVLELGVSDLVTEDLNLLQHIKTVFLEFPKLRCSENSISIPWNDDNDKDPICEVDHDVLDVTGLENYDPVLECGGQTKLRTEVFPLSIPSYVPSAETEFNQNGNNELQAKVCEESKADSPDSLYESDPDQLTQDSFMKDGVNGGDSQVQSWQLMDDDDFSNCVPISMNSSDCISQTFLNPEKHFTPPNSEKSNNHMLDLQDCNRTKFSSLDLGVNDLHYTRTLSVILGNSNPLTALPRSHNGNKKSSFLMWKKERLVTPQKPHSGVPQKMLKKILCDVPLMHGNCFMKVRKENGGIDELYITEEENFDASHFLLEKNEKLDDQILALRSLVPSVNKFDRASVLSETIEYLKDLERRVEELESCRELTEFKSKGTRKYLDIAERSTDNYFHSGNANGKFVNVNKRKACDIEMMCPELDWVSQGDDLAADVNVCIEEKEITIAVSVPWRECLLLEIMEAVCNLQLDAYSVHSSTSDGILSLTLKSKFKGAGPVSAGTIKLAIEGEVSRMLLSAGTNDS